MSKKVILVIIVIILLGGIGGILIPKKDKSKIKGENLGTLKYNENKHSSTNNKNEEIVYMEPGKISDFDKGYYYINNDGNIKYFDYSAKKEIYLCNKPNCKHNEEECSSYLGRFNSTELFVYNNYLYLISSTGSVTIMSSSMSEDGTSTSQIGGETPKIYRMNLDGTNKTKLFECPSGVELDSRFIFEGNNIYTFFLKNKVVELSKNSHTSIEIGRELVKINLETKKYEEILNGKDKKIIGIYNGNIVLEEIVDKQNPEEFLNNDNAYINNLRNSTKKIKLFDLSNKTEKEIYQDIYKNMEDIQYENGKVYFVAYKGQKIEYIDLGTKQKQTLCDLPKKEVFLKGIYDNKLQYVYYTKKESELDKAYYIDLETKESKELNLFDKNGYLVEILAKNKEFYFIIASYDLGEEHISWAGTKQQNIEKINYALIKKEDYWKSNPEYINMKNT